MSDVWNPDRYAQFREQRSQPFFDLLALVNLPPGGRVIDLGCGTGELTREMHRRLQAAQTVAIDNSPKMLDRAQPLAGDGLRFEQREIQSLAPGETYDLVFSNAALQWLPDHAGLLSRLSQHVAPGGQLAIQLPAMENHPLHATAKLVAQSPPFEKLLGGYVHRLDVLPPERYAEILHELGFQQQHVRLQMFGHELPSAAAAVDWARGTLLTSYEQRLPPEQFEPFVAAYRDTLLKSLPAAGPYFLVYQRILMWAKW